MRTSRLALIVLVGLIAAGGAGYLMAVHEGQNQLSAAAQEIRTSLGPNGSFQYASASIHPLQRAADLQQVALRLPSGMLYTAQHIRLVDGDNATLAQFQADGIRIVGDGRSGTMQADSLHAEDISMPPPLPSQPVQFDFAKIRFKRAVMTGMTFEGPSRTATLARAEVDDWGAGQASTLAASGFSAPLPSGKLFDHAGFATLRVSGIDFASALNAAERHLPVPTLTFGTARAQIDGIYLAQGAARPATIAETVVSGTQDPSGAGSVSRVSLSGIHMEPHDPKAVANLADLGLHAIDMNFTADTHYTLAGGVLDFAPRISVRHLGTLALDVHLKHLDPASLASAHPDPKAALLMLAVTQIVSAEVHFTDAGLLDRMLSRAATQSGLTPTQMRALAIARIGADPMFAELPNGAAIQTALVGFVAHGGTLALAMRPPTPLSVLQLAAAPKSDPVATIRMIGLTTPAS